MKRKDAALVAELLIKYQYVFSKGDLNIGQFNGTIKHHIKTGDAKPSKQRLWRTSSQFEKEKEHHLNQMLQKNAIQKSTSEWAATPVLIRKKDGSLRYCINYKALNQVTIKDAFRYQT